MGADIGELLEAYAPGTGRADELASALTEDLRRLRPYFRSLTGNGVRSTLDIIAQSIPLERREVPSGTRACDWVIPDEWNVRAAHLTHADGRRVLDIDDDHLHLVAYSVPVRERMTLTQLRPHLHTLPDRPDWIPYRNTFFNRDWGFCLSQRQLDTLDEGPYDVVIDTTLEPGSLTYGEVVLPGDSEEEFLFSSHICHPSLVNDNLSGIAVATRLAALLAQMPSRRYTYRFVFAPATLGAVTWLSRNGEVLPRLRHGLVLTGLGGPGHLVYQDTRRSGRPIDLAAGHVVSRLGGEVRDYRPWGYDERQYNSLGFDLPVGRLSRTPHDEYPEYHTSGDDLGLVTGGQLADSLHALLRIVDVLENDARYRNLQPYGEPQLGRRGLYPTIGGKSADEAVMAMLWTLALSDGETSALDVARRADLDFAHVRRAAQRMAATDLLARVDD